MIHSSEIHEKEPICFADSHLITGKTTYESKKVSRLLSSKTKSLSQKTIKNLDISFTLEFSYPNKKIDFFEGYLKLFKDPKIEKLTYNNFIPKGCIIKKSDWIIGMVVYCGNDTKLMKNSKLTFLKSSFLENVSQIYFLTICIIVIICSMVIYLINILKFFLS